MKKKQSKKQETHAPTSAVATLGFFLVIFGAVVQFLFLAIMVFSRTFDYVLLYPLVPVVMGLVLIKLSGVNVKTALPGIAENVLGLFFPFA